MRDEKRAAVQTANLEGKAEAETRERLESLLLECKLLPADGAIIADRHKGVTCCQSRPSLGSPCSHMYWWAWKLPEHVA